MATKTGGLVLAKKKTGKPATKANAAKIGAPANMNTELAKVYFEMRDLIARADTHNIGTRWKLGRKVQEVLTDDRKYEVGAAEKLADALNVDVQNLYRCRNLADTYDKEQLEALLTRTTANGNHISASHLDHLIRVPKDAMREKLTNMVFEKNLSVRELASQIQAKLGNRSNNPKGRPSVGPKTPLAAMAMVRKNAERDSDAFAALSQHMTSVTDQPAEYASDQFLADLTEAKAQTKVIADAAADALATLAEAEAAVSKSLRLAKNQALGDRTSDKATVRAQAARVLGNAPRKKVPLKLKPKKVA